MAFVHIDDQANELLVYRGTAASGGALYRFGTPLITPQALGTMLAWDGERVQGLAVGADKKVLRALSTADYGVAWEDAVGDADMIPDTDDTYDIGTTALRWADAFVTGLEVSGTLDLRDSTRAYSVTMAVDGSGNFDLTATGKEVRIAGGLEVTDTGAQLELYYAAAYTKIWTGSAGDTYIWNSDSTGDFYFGGYDSTSPLRMITGSDFWYRYYGNKIVYSNTGTSGRYDWQFNYDSVLRLTYGAATTATLAFDGLGIFSPQNPSRSSAVDSIRIDAAASGGLGTLANFGGQMVFNLETATAGQKQIASEWRAFWTDPTNGSQDSTVTITVRNTAALVDSGNLFVVSGESEGVGINKASASIAAKLHVGGDTQIDDELHLDGDFNHDGSNLGVFGTAPTTKQTVTGSRGGNAALQSLLTALAAYGAVTDSSSA